MADILLVDDDAAVLEVLAAIVKVGGHGIVKAHNAAEALEILRSELAVDLLIVDVDMPDVNGFRLARMARNRRPDLRVIYLAGYWDPPEIRNDKGPRFGNVLK